MNSSKFILAAAAALALMSGCSSRPAPGASPDSSPEIERVAPSIKARDASPELDPTQALRDDIFTHAGGNPYDLDGEKINHNFPPIYFGFNSALVDSRNERNLQILANYILQNPSYHLIINGHCDARGSDDYNRMLSEKRALSVFDTLLGYAPIKQRLHTMGYGEEKPARDGSGSETHAANRRVEFEIISVSQ